MNKIYVKFVGLFLGALMSVVLFSCGDDAPATPANPSDTPTNPIEPSEGEAMSPTKQKEYLEVVALDFMDNISTSDFNDISDLAEDIANLYGDNYDWDGVADWAENAFEASREALGTTTTEENGYNSFYVYSNYKSLLMASNFTGHFTARNGGWVRENSNILHFDFTDKQGNSHSLKLETGGSVKRVHVLDHDDWTDYDGNYSSGYTNYYDRTAYTIGVPERIVVSLSQGSHNIIKTTINFDLSNITDEEFDLSKNSLNLSASVEIDNGYKIDVSKFAYNANDKVSVSFVFSKGNKNLITMGVASDVNDIPSVNLSAFGDFDFDDYDTDNTNAKNAFVKLDILGKVQIQGTLSDVRKFVDYMDEADDNDSNESTFKSYVNQANSLADINLFYNGNSVKQATIKLEPFVSSSWNGNEYWKVEPVMCFFDGSSYSTFEAFFYEKDFKKTIDTFEKLIDDFADLFDQKFDW